MAFVLYVLRIRARRCVRLLMRIVMYFLMRLSRSLEVIFSDL